MILLLFLPLAAGGSRIVFTEGDDERVHRSEAVHPAAAKVDRQKAFIALQTFPEALRVMEGLREWFAPWVRPTRRSTG